MGLWRGLWGGGADGFVLVLPPIETEGLTAADVDDLTSRTRELMLRELVALTAEERGRQAVGAGAEVETSMASGADYGNRHVDGRVNGAL